MPHDGTDRPTDAWAAIYALMAAQELQARIKRAVERGEARVVWSPEKGWHDGAMLIVD